MILLSRHAIFRLGETSDEPKEHLSEGGTSSRSLEAVNVKCGNVSVFVVFNIFHLKEVRDECEKLRDTISSKDKKLARMNKAFGNKVKY